MPFPCVPLYNKATDKFPSEFNILSPLLGLVVYSYTLNGFLTLFWANVQRSKTTMTREKAKYFFDTHVKTANRKRSVAWSGAS